MKALKSLLDIQKDIRNLENTLLEIQTNIKQINNDIDDLRNQDNNIEFDYNEIKKLSELIPFGKHPICYLNDESTIKLYMEMLINIIKFDDKNREDKIDTRLVFLQWILNNTKINLSLEELIIGSLKVKTSDFYSVSYQLEEEYKKMLVVDLLIVANMNGTFNADECNYVADILTILGIDATKAKLLSTIAKMVLCPKQFESCIYKFDSSLRDDLIGELGKYGYYLDNSTSQSNVVKQAILTEFEDIEFVVYDNDQVYVEFCNFKVEGDEVYFIFWVRNYSGQTIHVYAQEIYVDGVKVTDYMKIGEFEPGECTHERFSLDEVTPDTYYTINAFIEVDDEDDSFVDSGDVFSIYVDFDDRTLSAEME